MNKHWLIIILTQIGIEFFKRNKILDLSDSIFNISQLQKWEKNKNKKIHFKM